MSKLIILHYETQEVLVYDYDEFQWNPEDFMSDQAINSSNCHWMVVDELNIKIMNNEKEFNEIESIIEK